MINFGFDCRFESVCVCYNGAQDYWVGPRLGVYGEGDYEIEEDSGRVAGASVQLGGVHDALYVSLFLIFWLS